MKPQSNSNQGYEIHVYESQGVKLRYGLYKRSDAKKISKYIFLLPGRSEYIEKYNLLSKKLNISHETALVVLDHRGQGASGGYPFHICSYDEYCLDVKNLIKKIILNEESYSFIACSMGGLISVYGQQKGYFSPKRILLTGPLISLPKSNLWFFGVFALTGFLHCVGLGKKRWKEYTVGETFEDNILTNNRAHYELLKTSPFPPKEGSFSWIYATLKAIFYIKRKSNVKRLSRDLTICIARDEKVVSNEAIYNWLKKVQESQKKSLVHLYQFQTKHEMFFDTESEANKLFNVINAWINSKCSIDNS